MLAIIVSWFIISAILISFGDILISLYKYFTHRDEEYNLLDTILLGICFLLVPLCISSLWFPLGFNILLIFGSFSCFYWIFNKGRFVLLLKNVKDSLRHFSRVELLSLFCFIIALALFSLWSQPQNFDPAFYHYEHIRWNEQFDVVPGLANLEHRFGFDSNYFPVSAIFTLRYLFTTPVYFLQLTLAIYILGWVYSEMVKSRYELKRLLLFFAFALFFFYNIKDLGDTSTDIIPNLCTFYLAARFLLYLDSLRRDYLLAFVLPIMMVTFKISTFPFGLLSLVVLISLLKQKMYRPAIFLIIAALFILLPWFIRNVIISGYLVFPVTEIDLFNFDWEVPHEVAILERDYISHMGEWKFHNLFKHTKLMFTNQHFLYQGAISATILLLLAVVCVSPLIVLFKVVKKRYADTNVFIIYIILFTNIVYWFVIAPDIRFIYGCLFAAVYCVCLFLLPIDRNIYCKRIYRSVALYVIPIFFLLSSFSWLNNYRERLRDQNVEGMRMIAHIAYKPYSSADKMRAKDIVVKFNSFNLNNGIAVYVSSGTYGFCFDTLPCVCGIDQEWKFQDIRFVKARGFHLEDGFRSSDTISDQFMEEKKQEFEETFDIED